MTKSQRIQQPRHQWTEVEDAKLRKEYPHKKTEDIADAMGLRLSQIYQRAGALGLKKSVEFMAGPASSRTNGRQGIGKRFEKGSVPWNKGIPFNSGGDSVKTQFKAGAMPHNTQPVGSYRLDKDGTLQRKVSNDKGNNSKRWRSVHELVWIDANGPVPTGHIVVFKAEMRTAELSEITIDRVECISLAENMRRNSLHRLPKEIVEVIQLRGALQRQINKRVKNERTEDHC